MIASDTEPSSEHVLKRLSLSHLPPSSSSPFPSPSSSFLPPPVPSNHEFANKAVWTVRKKSPKDTSPPATAFNQPAPNPPVLQAQNVQQPPTIQQQPIAQTSAAAMASMRPLPDGIDTSAANSLLSPNITAATPTQHVMSATAAGPVASTLTPLASPRTSGNFTPATPSGLHSSRSSISDIHPSRAAPPSPVPSRRPSMRRSGSSRRSHGGTSSKSNSITSIPPTPGKRKDTKPAPSRVVKVRDFAYSSTDPRHTGTGPDVTSPETPSRRSSGWGGFRWSGLASKLPWTQRTASPQPDAGMPSQSDFDRNFGGDTEDADIEVDGGEYEYDDEEPAEGAEGELRPGWYRALYAFEPEGTAEMALREDQHVRVLGRGGGVGWAVARVEGGEGCALVPESYLEWLAPFEPGEEEGYDSGPDPAAVTAMQTDESELTYGVPHRQEPSGGHTPRTAAKALPG